VDSYIVRYRKHLLQEDINWLNQPFTDEETHEAFFLMNGWKSPSPAAILALLYHEMLHIIGHDVIAGKLSNLDDF